MYRAVKRSTETKLFRLFWMPEKARGRKRASGRESYFVVVSSALCIPWDPGISRTSSVFYSIDLIKSDLSARQNRKKARKRGRAREGKLMNSTVA